MDARMRTEGENKSGLTNCCVGGKGALPQESLVRIFVNGEFCSSILCTPYDLKELSVGWLFNQGYVESMSEIAVIGACDDMRDISIRLKTARYLENARAQIIKTSACMGGEISYRQFFKDAPKLNGGPIITIPALKLLTRKALSRAHSYRASGGVHYAAIASAVSKQIEVFFEDVGRHTAVDKAMGRMFLTHQSLEDKIVLTSGRISSEMALKAVHGRISMIVSLTICTNLAAQIAKEAGLTLVCRVLRTCPLICCGEQRIVTEDAG